MRKALLVLAALLAPVGALAQAETLKVAVSQRGFWDSSFVEFAQKEGFLKEAGLDVDLFYTDGGAQTDVVLAIGLELARGIELAQRHAVATGRDVQARGGDAVFGAHRIELDGARHGRDGDVEVHAAAQQRIGLTMVDVRVRR